jgi:hypothetical protein
LIRQRLDQRTEQRRRTSFFKAIYRVLRPDRD